MTTTLTFLEQDGHGPAALRIQPQAREDRTPTHFIALLDISESMADGNKLTHVKHCMSLLLKFLTPEDELSLITFGGESTIVLHRTKVTGATLSAAEGAIQALGVLGCTNLSAGLASVRQILDEARAAGSPLKQGLLVLTDGHANLGVSDPVALRGLCKSLLERFAGLSISYVAYGTDHNAGLLKAMAEDANSAYSVVETVESAALTMGEALGSMISCVAQNVIVEFPPGTVGSGPHKVAPDTGRLILGDLYAGSEVLVLATIPSAGGVVRVSGVALPSLDSFSQEVTDRRTETGRNPEIELTRLRYQCSDLFRQIREARRGATDDLRTRVAAFRTALEDASFQGNPIADMLRHEAKALEDALRELERGGGARLTTQLLQHEAYTSLMRGCTQDITPAPPAAGRAVRWAGVAYASDEEENPSPCSAAPAAAAPNDLYLSPSISAPARRMATAMRQASSAAAPPSSATAPSSPSSTPAPALPETN